MPLEIVPVLAEHIPELARIVFEAFRDVQECHRFPLDIPSEDVAKGMLGMFTSWDAVYGVAAVLDGTIVGSNFVQRSDAVAGIGPITVEVSQQARGIGRTLMQHIIDWCLRNHGPMIRLLQESFNLRSLALYTSLGFTAVEPLVLMEIDPAEADDPSVRRLNADDLQACEVLCRRILKVSRKNELAFMIRHGEVGGFIPHGRFRSGKLAAYLIPGFVGHGVGESADDLLAIAVHAARHVPSHARRLFIPIRNGELFRKALKLKMRGLKPMTLMAMGPYVPPETGTSAWTPSITY